MSNGFGRLRDRLVNAATGVELRSILFGLRDSIDRLERSAEKTDRLMGQLRRRLDAQTQELRAKRDNIDQLIIGLNEIRGSVAYESAYSEVEPLVTVRIASFLKTRELMDITLPSVFAQSYQRFEVVIVNDGPNPNTREAIERLGDSRVRYEEFPARNSYPDDQHARWMVAGSPGMNRAASLGRGSWIAPLDDDDAFTPNHIEALLTTARETKSELVYGALIQRNTINGNEALIWSDPPSIGQFSFQAAMYNAALGTVFSYDTESWLVDEPGDWNLIRRMSAAGVSMTAITDVVAIVNHIPYTHKEQE